MKTASTLQYKETPTISVPKLNGRISIPVGSQQCPLKKNNNSDSSTNATFKKNRQYPVPYKFIIYMVILLTFLLLKNDFINAKDPEVSSSNFGLINMQAGKSRPPGWYYIQYIQIYQPQKAKDAYGNEILNAGLNSSILYLPQIAFIGKKQWCKGNIGFTFLLPFVKVTPDAAQGNVTTVNPSPVGDFIAGTFIQWYDKQFLGLPLAHRFGINVVLPTGAFSNQYDINPGDHRFKIFPHYEFTLNLFKPISISVKNNLYYHFKEIGDGNRPAIANNINYALEFKILNTLTLAATGYYLTQFGQDSYNGDHHYYYEKYGITDTRERVLGSGFGLGYSMPKGLSVELKGMWETNAKNRTEGFRGTLVCSYPL